MEYINLYTIGFTKKSAEDFFTLLKNNNIKTLIDVRLNNVSQLAGFTKQDDLKFFLKEICGIGYKHIIDFSPTDFILKRYKDKEINWDQYEIEFKELIKTRRIEKSIDIDTLRDACLLCSEPTAEKCHRRLVAEYFREIYKNLNIIHL